MSDSNDTGDEEVMEKAEGGECPVEKKLGRTVKVLGLVSLFTDASSEMIYPLLPIFLSSVLGAGPAIIGVIEGVAEGTASVLKGFSGYLSDRLHKRRGLILAGYGLSALTKPFFAASAAAWQVLLIRFTDRVGKGIRTAPRDAMIAESTDRAIWGKAYGFHRAMDTLGAVVGPGLAFLMMWALSGQGDDRYRWVFLAAFIPGLVAVCLILFVLKEEPFKSATKFPGLRLAGFGRSYKMLLMVVAVFTLGNSSDAFLLLKAQDVFEQAGISGMMIPVLIPLIWLTFNVVYSSVSMPAGILSDRIGRKETLLIGFFLYALIYLGFAFAGSTLVVWLLMAAYGVFYGLTEGVMKAFVADLSPEEMKGTAFGVYHATDGISRLLASIIFGVLWQLFGAATAFLFGAGLAVVAAFLLWNYCEEPSAANHPPAT